MNLARDKIRLLEEQIQSLSADIAKLRLSQFEMLGEVQNCCHNDTYFAAVIKSQINDVLSKVKFLLWILHSSCCYYMR